MQISILGANHRLDRARADGLVQAVGNRGWRPGAKCVE